MGRIAYTFGSESEFVLDTRRLELRRNGERQDLAAVPCRILGLLCEADGNLVTRTELRDAVWNSRVTGFDDRLNTAVASIRACLRDEISSPQFLRTERGRGYRFIAEVKSLATMKESDRGPTEDHPVYRLNPNTRARHVSTPVLLVAASFILLAIGISIKDVSPVATEAFATVLAGTSPATTTIDIRSPTTTDPVALDAYRRGMTGIRSIDYTGIQEADALFALAVNQDPDFGLAYIGLSVTRSTLLWMERSDTRLADAQSSLARASQVAGSLPEFGLALGAFHLFVERDYESALSSLAKAAEERPFDAEIFATAGSALMRAGRWEESVKAFDRALALDRFNPDYTLALAIAHDRQRDFQRGQRYYSMAASASMSVEIVVRQAIGALQAGDSTDNVAAQLREAGLRIGIEPLRLALFSRFLTRVVGPHLVDTSVPLREFGYSLVEESNSSPRSQAQFITLAVAALVTSLGDVDLGREFYGLAVDRLQATLPSENMLWTGVPTDQGLYARALAGSGRFPEAIHEVDRILEAFPLDRDALTSPYLRVVAAEVLVQSGEEVRALDLLETLLAIPAPVSRNSLLVDPVWDPVREHPRFVALVQSGDSHR